jgi:plasmid stabilization system protein ParE
LIYTPQIESDYNDAYHWYELQQAGLGEKFLLKVREKLSAIIEAPEVYGNKGRKGYREAIVDGFPYLIVYKVYPKKKTIFISSISHSKVNPNKKYRSNP